MRIITRIFMHLTFQPRSASRITSLALDYSPLSTAARSVATISDGRAILIFSTFSIVDFIRNNDLYHNLSPRFRCRTRRLCKPQAISMSRSAMPSLVLRNTSFILRERFTPARACATRTRRREIFRFARFSAFVSSPCRGFFSAAASARPRVRTPESPCPWRG